MLNYNILKNELVTDPLAIGYATMTDAEAVAALNALTRTKVVDYYANAKTILSKLGSVNGAAFLDALDSLSATNSAVKWAMSFITSAEGINVGDSVTRNMLDQLVTAGILDSADVSTVKSLAEQPISRAAELNLNNVTEGDVQYARSI